LVDIDTRTKQVTFNPELIALAHAGKFLRRGAVRISTPAPLDDGYSTIAYLNPDGTVVHVTENTGPAARSFVVPAPNGDFYRVNIPAGGAATITIPPVIQ
jgi:glucosylceramidase